MADALRASCAAPVFKRPRLEYSSCDNDTLISYESVSSEERFSVDSGLQEDAYDMTSSNEGPIESVQENDSINGIPGPSTSSLQDPSLEHGIITDHANGFSADVFNDIAILSDPPAELEEPNFEEHDSTISELSGLSDLSNYSEDIEPNSASASWVQRQRNCGIDPRMILGEILPKGTMIPLNVNDGLLWRYIINMLNEPRRSKLNDINTLDDAVHLLKTCKNIIVLTGAGVSVSCGIPDFRSRNGIYARLSKDYPDLPDPQAMFDISYFRRDPRPFFKFAKEIYPGQFQPTPSHRFIKLLERQGKLLRNYTQNIDTLEHTAGIKNVITCHGSFATATCTICRYKVDSSVIKEDIFNQTIPYCPICPSDIGDRGIMKPDIVFFGEGLSDEFHDNLACDKEICDLLIVIGSSLKVRPVAMIPCSIPMNVPQILINREPLKHLTFDIELLGDCDGIIGELCKRLQPDWSIEDIPSAALSEITFPPTVINTTPLDFSEINNNSSARTDAPTSSLSQGDESNSCDYRGMSAIKLDDSEDGSSNQEKPTKDAPETKEDEVFSAGTSREDCLKKLPDNSYMFIPPNRYIFQGAEINKEDEDDDSRSSCTDYSSDSEDPPDNPALESTDNSTSPPRFLPQPPSPSTSPQLTKEEANT